MSRKKNKVRIHKPTLDKEPSGAKNDTVDGLVDPVLEERIDDAGETVEAMPVVEEKIPDVVEEEWHESYNPEYFVEHEFGEPEEEKIPKSKLRKPYLYVIAGVVITSSLIYYAKENYETNPLKKQRGPTIDAFTKTANIGFKDIYALWKVSPGCDKKSIIGEWNLELEVERGELNYIKIRKKRPLCKDMTADMRDYLISFNYSQFPEGRYKGRIKFK